MVSPKCTACFGGLGKLCSRGGVTPRASGRPTLPGVRRRCGKEADLSDAASGASTEASESDDEPPCQHPNELVAARALKAMVEADKGLLAAVERHRCGEGVLALCLRFAVARPRSREQALEMLRACLQAREESGILDWMTMSQDRVLVGRGHAASPAVVKAFGERVPHGLLGYDHAGHVVVYRNYGRLQLSDLKHFGIGAEDVARHHHWLTEKALQAMGHRGRWTQIIDIQGVSWSQCTEKEHFAFVRMLASLDSVQYPERLAQVYIINAPFFFAGTFKMISRLLDPKTRGGIHLLAGKNQWQEALAKVMDLKILPRHMGGEGELFRESLPRYVPSLRTRSAPASLASTLAPSGAGGSGTPTPSSSGGSTWSSWWVGRQPSNSWAASPFCNSPSLREGGEPAALHSLVEDEDQVQEVVVGSDSGAVVSHRPRHGHWALFVLVLALCLRLAVQASSS